MAGWGHGSDDTTEHRIAYLTPKRMLQQWQEPRASAARWAAEVVPVVATCRPSAGGCCQEGGRPYAGWLDHTLTTTSGPQGLWGEAGGQEGGRVLIIRPRLARLAGRTTLWNAI